MTQVFLNFMNRGGGLIMWVIFAVSVVIWAVGLDQLLSLRRIGACRRAFLAQAEGVLAGRGTWRPTGHRYYDNLLAALSAGPACSRARFTALFREFLIGTVPQINAGFPTMTAWISVAPLLGLLGTVMGMIATFEVINTFGVGNPNLTAEGISVALLTTQAGLTVAFPGVLLQNFLVNRKAALLAGIFKDGEELCSKTIP